MRRNAYYIYIYLLDECYTPEVEMKTILGLPAAAPKKLTGMSIEFNDNHMHAIDYDVNSAYFIVYKFLTHV